MLTADRQLILLIGNYMNGTGVKGGAFGFRVSSINKVRLPNAGWPHTNAFLQLVDTKSVNNTTLLHFLERTVSKYFPDMEEFLEELNRPSEAYRGTIERRPHCPDTRLITVLDSLQDARKDLANLREGLKKIRQELTDHFANVEPSNQYGTKMWAFLKKATAGLEDLVDEVNAAESTFSEVAQFYGEDEKNTTSSEFYGIFKTFITSYRVSVGTFEARPFTVPINTFTEMQDGQPNPGGAKGFCREEARSCRRTESCQAKGSRGGFRERRYVCPRQFAREAPEWRERWAPISKNTSKCTELYAYSRNGTYV